jgi:ABC-type amino acid transport substrate-binding protein
LFLSHHSRINKPTLTYLLTPEFTLRYQAIFHNLAKPLLLKFFILALFTISSAVQAEIMEKSSDKQLTMCVTHYPPYQITSPEQAPIGENIAITTHFFNTLGFTINFTKNNSFWRCLAMLEAGKVDLMSGLLDAPERRDFAHLFSYSSLNEKSFYVKNKNLNISRFSDLKGLKVAVLRGIKQFKQFDNAPDGYLEKVYVSDLDAAIRILAAGKVDVFISTDFLYLKKFKDKTKATQEIEKIIVKLDDSALLFTGLSKKSKVAHLAPKFSKLSKVMHESGEFKKIINKFKMEYPEYYR